MNVGFSVCVRSTSALVIGGFLVEFSLALRFVVFLSAGVPVSIGFQTAILLCSLVILKARVARVNSLFTFFSPRVRN